MNRLRLPVVPLFSLCAALVLATTGCVHANVRERAATLRKGVNLSHWYAQSITGRYDEERLSTYFTAADIALIKSMGFDHVRLTLNERVLFDPAAPGRLKAEPLAKFEQRVDALLAAGLKVIIDLHTDDAYREGLRTPAGEAAILADWPAMAARFSSRPPERLFFELLNEPGSWETADWTPVQGRLLAAVRRAAPRHTIIVTPGKWSDVDELLKMEPYPDDNVIYTIHWYDPNLFTHQSASWSWESAQRTANLGWPVAPADADAATRAATADPVAARHLDWQIKEGWFTRDHAARQLDKVAAWQRQHGGVPVHVGEFGVYTKVAPAEARYRWHETMRKMFEERGWGWTIWDYRGGFRVVIDQDGKTAPDERMRAALGLAP